MLSAQFFGDITSVSLSNNQESQTTTFTITATAADDQNSGDSFVAAGQLAGVGFPAGFDATGVSSGTITIGNVSTPITGFTPNGSSTTIFTMPVSLPAGNGFTLVINDVKNAPFNSACGTTANTYASASPCDGFIQVLMVNALNNQSFPNVYHHYTQARFDIVPAPYFITDIQVDKPNLSGVVENSLEQELVRVYVGVAGSQGTLPVLDAISFSAGSTQAAHVDEAQIWYTGADAVFHGANDQQLAATNLIGSGISASPNLSLQAGDNYFWLAYDIACFYGLVGNTVDGVLNSIEIDGQTYTPGTPVGTREIVQDYTVTSTNLVPNPSFESYTTCPDGIGQWSRLTNWEAVPVTNTNAIPSSPDFFNRCDQTSSYADVPVNGFGSQEPRTGDGYAGIYTSGFFDWKEYLQVPLSTPLQAGETYAVTYYISAADYDLTSNYEIGKRHDGMGFMFSNTQPTSANSIYGLPAGFTANYISTDIVEDNVDWVPVRGTYTALGGEQWLTIGCFLNGPDLATNGGPDFGYYYIDDVTVAPLTGIASSPCQQIELLVEVTGESCPGADDGAADIQVFGGLPPYSISWSDNGTGAQRSNLAAGLYNITVTDANNATYQDVVFIQPATPLAVDMTVVDVSAVGSSDGSISTTVTNGTGPFSYQWHTGETTADITNIPSGTYSLTVTDANGCQNNFTVFVGAPLACNGAFSNFPYIYDTEQGLGLFRQNQDDDSNWRRRSGTTPTANTGPSGAYSGSRYRYVESSGSNSPFKTAVLTINKCLDITAVNNPVFSFYYNMNGGDLGTLYVQLSTDGGSTWTGPVWSTSGDQGDNWQQAVVYLSGYSSTQLRIRLAGTTGKGPLSDIAFDSYYIGEYTGTFLQAAPAIRNEVAEDVSSSIKDETESTKSVSSSLRISPNPSDGNLWLSWNQLVTEPTQLDIIDQLGRQVYQVTSTRAAGLQREQLQLDLQPGMYFVRITSASNRLYQPMIIVSK